MFGRIGVGELVLILAIALIIFGPAKLPELGKVLGEAVRNFRKSSDKIGEELTGTIARPSAPLQSTAPAAQQAAPAAQAPAAQAPAANAQPAVPRQVGVTVAEARESVGAAPAYAENEKA